MDQQKQINGYRCGLQQKIHVNVSVIVTMYTEMLSEV